MKNLLFWTFMVLNLTDMVAQNNIVDMDEVVTGDLLFYGDEGALSRAIDEVTKNNESKNYSHMGIAEVDSEGVLWVIHSIPGKGVVRELFPSFASGTTSSVNIYRVDSLSAEALLGAVAHAKSHIGEPYNYTYVLEDKGVYCSELVYYAFLQFNVFELNPMTFVDPTTGKLHRHWKRYYHRLGRTVPEGLLGCNPNGMAAHPALKYIGAVVKK